jgi:prephenate dehydrogenase
VRIGKLVVVGVGLIGGSCALALRQARAVDTVIGIGRTRSNLDAAQARGIIDRAYTLREAWTHELADAELVLIAVPTAEYPPLLEVIAPAIGSACIVTDAGSTKRDVVAMARAAFASALPRFVPAHPIAGSEQSGANAADATLFDKCSVVLTPLAETSQHAVDLVTSMWTACGAQVSSTTPDRHDRIFAAVSHLPHVLAFAFVSGLAARPDGETLLAHAGSGFRDFTRIAASSPEMWRGIVLANHDALLDELALYRVALDDVARLIATADGTALAALFARAAQARQRWGDEPPAAGDGA